MSPWEAARQEWAELSSEFRIIQEAEYAAAVDATHGVMVGSLGLRKGWDSWGVFTANATTQARYASRELLDHLERYPRMTLRQWERAWRGEP